MKIACMHVTGLMSIPRILSFPVAVTCHFCFNQSFIDKVPLEAVDYLDRNNQITPIILHPTPN
jgi:hypothetical protein